MVIPLKKNSTKATVILTLILLINVFVTIPNTKELNSIGTKAVGYVIVTTEEILHKSKNLTKYVDFLSRVGYNVYVITEKDYGQLKGQERALKIRAWLKNHYKELNIMYVLLIGNPDPDDPRDPNDTYGDVPMIMTFPYKNSALGVPTDFFYADLTGSCDLDGDGLCGEYPDDLGDGSIDFKPDVYVGRIPVYNSNTRTLDDLLGRLMKKEPPPRSLLLVLSVLNYKYEEHRIIERTDGHEMADLLYTKDIQKYLNVSGMYEMEGIRPISKLTAFYNFNLTYENFIEEWNKGYGVVLISGHGNSHGIYRRIWSWDDGDDIPESNEICIDPIVNLSIVEKYLRPKPTVLFLASCSGGYPEDYQNIQYVLLKRALVTIGATRDIWYRAGEWSPNTFPSQFDIGYKFLLEIAKTRRVGIALYNVLSSFDHLGSQKVANIYAFNMYGDPSFSLYGWPTKTIHIPEQFSSLFDAIPYVSPFTKIIVNSDTRTSRSIVLQGIRHSFLDIISTNKSSPKCSCYSLIIMNATNINIKNLKIFAFSGINIENSIKVDIKECKFELMPFYGGFRIVKSSRIQISNNSFISIRHNASMIIASSFDIRVIGNTFQSVLLTLNNAKNILVTGNTFDRLGVVVKDSVNNVFINNTVGSLPLLYIEGKENLVIEGKYGEIIVINSRNITIRNVSVKGSYMGILTSKIYNLSLFGINISSCKYGMYIESSSKIIVNNTALLKNLFGIYLNNSTNVKISWSKFYSNIEAIAVENSSHITITCNTIDKSTIAIRSIGSQWILVFLNNLFDNQINVLAKRPNIRFYSIEPIAYNYRGQTLRSMLGNYWGKLNIEDKDQDGVLDKPYNVLNENPDKYPLATRFEYYVGAYPRAIFEYSPKSIHIFQEVTFNASKSFGVVSPIVKYKWNFGDGHTATGRIVTHTYTLPGRYKVTLTVYDSSGLSSTCTMEIYVGFPWEIPLGALTAIAICFVFIALLTVKKREAQ